MMVLIVVAVADDVAAHAFVVITLAGGRSVGRFLAKSSSRRAGPVQGLDRNQLLHAKGEITEPNRFFFFKWLLMATEAFVFTY